MIQQLICTCCLVSAPQPITTLHPLSSCTFIPPSALQIRPYSAFKSLSAILYFLNSFFISRSFSVCWLSASGLENQMQTQWQQQDRSIPEDSPPRGHHFQDNNHKRLVTPQPSMRPITERNSSRFSLSDGLIMNYDDYYFACLSLRARLSPALPRERACAGRVGGAWRVGGLSRSRECVSRPCLPRDPARARSRGRAGERRARRERHAT